MIRLVIATTNPGKLAEFRALLAGLPLEVIDLRAFSAMPAVPETAASHAGNAVLKAVAAARHTGLPVLADDSGLEVDALGGAPGIHSARFGGEPSSDRRNLELLLARMRDVPPERRTARFRCAVVVARPDGRTLVAEGICEGFILQEPRGSGGFGYDPVFFHPPSGCTFAELRPEQKNALSHRARAVQALRARLLEFVRTTD